MVKKTLFGGRGERADSISDEFGVNVRKFRRDGTVVRTFGGQEFVGKAGFRKLENKLVSMRDSGSGGNSGQVGAPGFRPGGPNDPAEGGTGYVGGFNPQTGTVQQNGEGMATSLLVGVLILAYLAWRWFA